LTGRLGMEAWSIARSFRVAHLLTAAAVSAPQRRVASAIGYALAPNRAARTHRSPRCAELCRRYASVRHAARHGSANRGPRRRDGCAHWRRRHVGRVKNGFANWTASGSDR
jgi:hypothetical protein